MLISLAAAVLLARPFTPVFESGAGLKPQGRIDELVFAQWKREGIQPANLCSDAVFLRRAYLDVIGTLPTPEEATQFLQDQNPDKRRLLIDRLLDRPEFAEYWGMKWSDLLRVKAEFPVDLWPLAAEVYHHWIVSSIRENTPYDQFVRELLTASGSDFRVPPVNFYRAMQSRDPQGIAKTVALTFMGMRQSPPGMDVFFSRLTYKDTKEWKEQIVFFDPDKPATAEAKFPDGTAVRLAPDQDPRAIFAEWLTSPKNGWFARNIVNRVWYWLLGRGIIQEPDDIRPDNPPSNPELLAYLEHELVDAHYDLKHIYRLILNSTTYQLSSIPRTKSPAAAAAFAYYPLRRLDAEVLIDALCQVTGTTEQYTSLIPEPYTYIPEAQRSISLPDGSITSSFLEMFGRPARDTGLESERNDRLSDAQRLHLLNSSHVQQKIQQSPKLRALMRGVKNPQALVDAVYLLILSRYPTAEELKAVRDYSQKGVRGPAAVVDLAWALINSAEFLYRH